MIGTSFAALTAFLAMQDFMPGELSLPKPTPEELAARTAYTAAIVGTAAFLVNLILSFFLPEPEADIDDEIGHAEVAPLLPPTVEPKPR
jgi:hypothetical protein